MKLRHFAFTVGILMAFASYAAAQDCQQWTISDTPPLDRIVIGPLTSDDEKGVKFSGAATLYLSDDTEILLEVRRKLRKKQGTWKYKLKTPRRAKPKVKCTAETGGDPEEVIKFKLKFKGEEKVKLKDPARVTLGECPPVVPIPTTFTVGPAGGSFDAADGKVSFFFPTGAVAEDTTITVTPSDPPPGTDLVTGATYRFEPDMSFLQPVDLTISYDPAMITGDENDLRLAKFLDGDPAEGIQQLAAHASVDTANNRVTGFITGFCCTGTMNIGSTALVAPDFTIEVNQDSSVTITWATPEAVVIIERSERIDSPRTPSDSDFTAAGMLHINAALLSWRDVTPANVPGFYWYRLRALRDGTTQSAPSPADRVFTWAATQPPPPPATLDATPFTCGGISLSWASVVEAESYRLERKLTFEPTYTQIATLLFYETSYIDTRGLSPGGEYDYRVFAVNSAGSSTARHDGVTNSESEYTVWVPQPDHWLRIPPGGSAEIDVTVTGHAGPVDVMLSASIDSTRVTAEFEPSTTDDQSVLTLTVDPTAPLDLRIVVDILTEPVGSGAPCAIPALQVTVGEPPPPPPPPAGPTLVSLEPAFVAAGFPASVTLTGTGFVPGTAVFVDGRPVESGIISDTEISTYIFPLEAGSHMVKVVNPGGEESNELELFAD
jgi:hypothetical protein